MTKFSHLIFLLIISLAGCGGGGSDTTKTPDPTPTSVVKSNNSNIVTTDTIPVTNTEPVVVPSINAEVAIAPAPMVEVVVNTPPFSSSYITLPDIYEKGTLLCNGDASKINWRMRTANLTKHTDGKKDIVVMMWCLATLGANTQAPIAGGIITFIQSNAGTFTDGTKTLFNVDMIQVDGALVTAEVVDLNNDGYDEVILLVTGEDGRNLSSPDTNIYGKSQVTLTSNLNGQYSVNVIGNKTFGDTIKTVQNGSTKNVLVSAIFGGSDQSFTLTGNNWTTDNYYAGVSLSGSFFSMGDLYNNINSVIHSDWTNKVYLKKKNFLSNWIEIDSWTPPSQGKIPFTSWNGTVGVMDYYKFNGKDITFLAFNNNCQIKDVGQTIPSTLFMSNAAIITGGYSGQKLTEGTTDFTPNMILVSVGVLNNKLNITLPTIRNPLANQLTSNYMTCIPLQNGPEQDIFVATQGPNAKPIVYIRENSTTYASVNQSKFPSSKSSGTYFTMLYEDIDGDGIPDVIYYPIFKDRQQKDPAIIYKGLRHISKQDLN